MNSIQDIRIHTWSNISIGSSYIPVYASFQFMLWHSTSGCLIPGKENPPSKLWSQHPLHHVQDMLLLSSEHENHSLRWKHAMKDIKICFFLSTHLKRKMHSDNYIHKLSKGSPQTAIAFEWHNCFVNLFI